jgi:hypothetical protein
MLLHHVDVFQDTTPIWQIDPEITLFGGLDDAASARRLGWANFACAAQALSVKVAVGSALAWPVASLYRAQRHILLLLALLDL